MNWICVGVMLVFLHLRITLNGFAIPLTPDWLGYILILVGMGKIPEATAFRPAKKILIPGIVLSLILWLPISFSLSGMAGFILTLCLEVATIFFQLASCRLVINGVYELERLYTVDLNYGLMIRAWWLMLAIVSLNALLSLSGLYNIMPALSYFTLILSLTIVVIIIVLVVALFRAKKPFAQAKAQYIKDREEAALLNQD